MTKKAPNVINSSSEGNDASILEEFHDFYKDVPMLSNHYKLISKIGEGTFSSVYKALDLNHTPYNNAKCCPDQKSCSCKGLVALKRIYVTSSPERIVNELGILHLLNGYSKVIPVITALRHEDQVIAVMPYFQHQDFRDYYLDLSVNEIKIYMRILLDSMSYIHENFIIHRDVKPSNFLFNRAQKTGMLVDFGLAQLEHEKRDLVLAGKSPGKPIRPSMTDKCVRKDIGYIVNDPRPGIRANRAGTRGFRAPEVLFKVPEQTNAIDIWSCGVIFLCILSGMFPFFASNDDLEAILEISHIFGKEEMEKLANKLGRSLYTNIPSINASQSLKDIVKKFNPHRHLFPESGFDLLDRLLTLDPLERITADDALCHPFFNDCP